MKKTLLLASCLAAAGFARADASISDVVVRPRWPWALNKDKKEIEKTIFGCLEK